MYVIEHELNMKILKKRSNIIGISNNKVTKVESKL